MSKGNPSASFNYKGKSALRYEVGPASKYNDITIFRDYRVHQREPYERVVADKGYVGEAPQFVKCPY